MPARMLGVARPVGLLNIKRAERKGSRSFARLPDE